MESTYTFIRKVLTTVQALHKDIQPLRTFHFGGDEVPKGVWMNSTACQTLKESVGDIPANATSVEIKKYFVNRMGKLASEMGLDLTAWEDSFLSHGESKTHERTSLPNTNVYAHAWDNVWEWGGGYRTYALANAGYKVYDYDIFILYKHHNKRILTCSKNRE